MPGYAAIFLALITTLVAAVYSLKNHSARRPLQTAGVRWYQLSAAFVAASSLYLLYLILSGQYQYAYVFSYSSRDLPLAYKLSAFWAGQEGSFLLWLGMHVSFGLILLRQKDLSAAVMAVYSGLQLLLTLFLLIKSPFMMLLQPPLDGNGLNPLLQDPWMVIHPPIVFLGYAGLAVPFSYAVGSLLHPGARSWLRPALPWALLSWGTLGAGIFIGGFWAYKVLGWGGYWAWDPVENSSLVPWLAAGALVHLMFLACLRPAGMRHAVMAALGSYVLVLYGTFLTRSGVLSDFSTHSFADEGAGGLLGAAVLAVAVASAVALILRWEELPRGELYPAVKSREFMLACTALILSMLAALVFVGMSTPVFTVLLGQAQNISPSFYNTTALPLAAALAVLLAAGPLYGSGSAVRLRRYWWALIAAHGGIYLTVSHGIYHPLIITVAFFAAGGLLINLHAAFHKTISRPAGLSHAGAALLLLGIVVSSAGSQSVNVTFEPGQSRLVFGQNLTYTGMERFPSGNGYYHNFRLDGSDIQSLTKLTREGTQAAREPAIYRTAASDLYVAPVTAREKPPGRTLILRKGEETDIEGIRLRYLRAVMSSPKADGEDIHIRAYLEASRDGRKEEAAAELAYHAGRVSSQPVSVLGSLEVSLLSVNPAEGAVTLVVRSLTAAPPVDSLMTEISRKPLISLVWLGTVLITAGTCWAAAAVSHDTTIPPRGSHAMLQTLTSMRTAIYMMLSIIGISLAATLLFPGAGVFSALWFRLLLALFCLNMAFCTFRQGVGLLAVSRAVPRTPPGSHWQRQEVAGVTAADLAAMLRQKGYRVAAEEQDGQTVLHADKHLAGRWGTLAVHIAVLLIAAGALTGNLLGFTQTVTVGKAETVALPLDRNGGRQAELTLRDFRIEYYPDGSVSEYISDLTVAAGSDIRRQTVRINHPLDYQGISLYQMDHGHQVLARRQSPGGAVLAEAWLADNGRLTIDDAAGISLAVLGYVPDFDPRRPSVSRSPFPNNPRVLYAFYRQNEAVDWGVAALDQTLILQGYDSVVTFAAARPYSVFEAKSDPGLPAVMSGFVLLSLAFFASLLLRYHQLSITFSNGARGPRADMAVGRLADEPAQLLLASLAEAAKGGSQPC